MDEFESNENKMARTMILIAMFFSTGIAGGLLLNDRTLESGSDFVTQDLQPWRTRGGIKEADLLAARERIIAGSHILIVNGSLYMNPRITPESSYETRDVGTLWGILELLEHSIVSEDVEMIFEQTNDQPLVGNDEVGQSALPFLVSFSGSTTSVGVVWPDWSFWGWPEVFIRPWEKEFPDIAKSHKIPASDLKEGTFWKGALLNKIRKDVYACGHSQPGLDNKLDINTVDWVAVTEQMANGESNNTGTSLAGLCGHKANLYVEGRAWSVSLKYWLACGGCVLRVGDQYFDFYSRQLNNDVHYKNGFTVNEALNCDSLIEASNWVHQHPNESDIISHNADVFLSSELSMDKVYKYMADALHKIGELQAQGRKRQPLPVQRINETFLRHDISGDVFVMLTKNNFKTLPTLDPRMAGKLERYFNPETCQEWSLYADWIAHVC